MTERRKSGRQVFNRWLFAMALASAPPSGALCATLSSIQEYKALALAPDGKRLAVVEPDREAAGDGQGSVVIRVANDGRILQRIEPCGCEFSGLAWSPDGNELAFLAADEKTKSVRLEVAAIAADSSHENCGNISTLGTISGFASTPRWAPGGSHIALLVTLDAKNAAGALEAASPQAQGYYVFLPNARGSYGQGEKFTRANIRDFGGGDLRDILLCAGSSGRPAAARARMIRKVPGPSIRFARKPATAQRISLILPLSLRRASSPRTRCGAS